MANALTSLQSGVETGGPRLHQSLHGYAEGHRLLESSIPIPDDLKRLMLRMSDLSGTSVVSGFQDYLTGYPLGSLNAYALAKTWYAPEMSRPGCVWTHTLIIPAAVMAQLTILSPIRLLFRRPNGQSISEAYSKPVGLEAEPLIREREPSPEQLVSMQAFIAAHYQKGPYPLIVPALNSHQYTDLIFAAWSQKWPSLRMSFTFSTGSLSARTIENHPLEVQCVPVGATRQVSREVAEAGFGKPVIVDFASPDLPRWTKVAANDALHDGRGPVRSFIWSVADKDSARADFESFVKIYSALKESLPFPNVLELTAELFPKPTDGRQLKRAILGRQQISSIPRINSKDILLALATTEHYQSFDPEEPSLRDQASYLLKDQHAAAYQLLGELFRASLNPIGDEILRTLILAMHPEDALLYATNEQQFLPALFRANAALATSAGMWGLARNHNRELFESVAAHPIVAPQVAREIVDALLESRSDELIGQAFARWGSAAVLEALDWIDAHGGQITEPCRAALRQHVTDVMRWVGTEREKSTGTLAALAHVVAPYSIQIAQYDSTAWTRALYALRENRQWDEVNYMSAFLLALGLCNAPPAPLDLISESFERVHRLAERSELTDDAWFILRPLVPELNWRKNWDWCERMRRALMLAFRRHGWPAWQLRKRIINQELVKQLLRSAREIRAEYYFEDASQ